MNLRKLFYTVVLILSLNALVAASAHACMVMQFGTTGAIGTQQICFQGGGLRTETLISYPVFDSIIVVEREAAEDEAAFCNWLPQIPFNFDPRRMEITLADDVAPGCYLIYYEIADPKKWGMLAEVL